MKQKCHFFPLPNIEEGTYICFNEKGLKISLSVLISLTTKYIKILSTEIGRDRVLISVIKQLGQEGKKVTKEYIPGKHLLPKDTIRNYAMFKKDSGSFSYLSSWYHLLN